MHTVTFSWSNNTCHNNYYVTIESRTCGQSSHLFFSCLLMQTPVFCKFEPYNILNACHGLCLYRTKTLVNQPIDKFVKIMGKLHCNYWLSSYSFY